MVKISLVCANNSSDYMDIYCDPKEKTFQFTIFEHGLGNKDFVLKSENTEDVIKFLQEGPMLDLLLKEPE